MKLSPTRGLNPEKEQNMGYKAKRLRTPAGTLTAKHQTHYTFSRQVRPSPIKFSRDSETVTSARNNKNTRLAVLSTPPRDSLSQHFATSEVQNEHSNITGRNVQLDAGKYNWLENMVSDLKPEIGKRFCIFGPPGSGRTMFLQQWTEERRITHPHEFIIFLEIKHCRLSKDYLYQVKQIALYMKSEIERHINRLKLKNSNVELVGQDKECLAVLMDSKNRLDEDNVFCAGERLTKQARQFLGPISKLLTFLAVLDGPDMLADRDAEGSNKDDVQDYLLSFPLNTTLVVSVNSNYELIQLWKTNGWYISSVPNTIDSRKLRKIIHGAFYGMPIVYENVLLETLEKELKLYISIELVTQHVKYAVDCHCKTFDSLEDHIRFAEEISNFLKFVLQRQGVRGLLELTYERLEHSNFKSSDSDIHNSGFVLLMACMLLWNAPLLLSNAALMSGIPENAILSLCENCPALFKIFVNRKTSEKELLFATSEARVVAMRRYLGALSDLHQAQAMYIRDAKYGASALTMYTIVAVEETFTETFSRTITLGKIISLHNAAALQAYCQNDILAYSLSRKAQQLCIELENTMEISSQGWNHIQILKDIVQDAVRLLERFMKMDQGASVGTKLLRPPTHQRSRLYTRRKQDDIDHSGQIGGVVDDEFHVPGNSRNGPETIIKLLQSLLNESLLKDIEAEFIHQSKLNLQNSKLKLSQHDKTRSRKAPRLKGVLKSADNRHIKKLKEASLKEHTEFNWYRLSRTQFGAALGSVFSNDVISSEDANILFDAMIWQPNQDISAEGNIKCVTWKNFVDLLANNSSKKSEVSVWKKSDDDSPLDDGEIAKRHKRYRTVLSKLIVVGHTGCYLGLTENGDLQVYDQKTKRLKQRINFDTKGLRATDICYVKSSRVCAVAVVKEDAPAFSGIYFYEPLVDWEKAAVEIMFEGRDSPPTSLAFFTGNLPASTASGVTTESKTLMMVGTRDGYVRFGTLNDFVYMMPKTLTVQPKGCTSTITCIDYVDEAKSVVCGSMDGKVYLLPFQLVGNIVDGLELRYSKRDVRAFENHSRPIRSFQYLSESHSIMSAGLDEVILVWRVRDFKVISYIKTGLPSNEAIALESTGQIISLDASVQIRNGQFHQGVHVWSLFGGTEMQVLELAGHTPIAPLVTGAPILKSGTKGACGSITYDAANNTFILGSHTLRQIVKVPVFSPSQSATHGEDIIAACFIGEPIDSSSSRGDISLKVLSVDSSSIVRLWNPKDGSAFSSFSAASPLPRNDPLASAACCDQTGQQVFIGYSDGNVASWRILKGVMLNLFKGTKRGIVSLAVACQSEMLCASIEGGDVIVWSIFDLPRVAADGQDQDMGKNAFIAAQNIIKYHSNISGLIATEIGRKKIIIGGDTESMISLWRPKGKAALDAINPQWYHGSARPTETVSNTGVCLLNTFTKSEEKLYCAATGMDGYLYLYCSSILYGMHLLGQRFSGGSSEEAIGCTCCASGTPWASLQSSTSRTKINLKEYIAVGDESGGIHIWRIELKTNARTEDTSPFPYLSIKNIGYWNGFKNKDRSNDSKPISVTNISLGGACQYVVGAGSDKTVRLYSIQGALIGIFGQSREWSLRSSVSFMNTKSDRPATSYPARDKWASGSRHRAMLSGEVVGTTDQFNFSRESSRWKSEPKKFLENTIYAINAINEGTIGADDINTEKGAELLHKFSFQTISPSLITQNLYLRRPLPKSPGTMGKLSVAEVLPRTPMQTFKQLKLHTKDNYSDIKQ